MVGTYILDLFCPNARLAVELDGPGHAALEQAAYAEERTQWFAEVEGIRVLRFWNQEVWDTDAVVEGIRTELDRT